MCKKVTRFSVISLQSSDVAEVTPPCVAFALTAQFLVELLTKSCRPQPTTRTYRLTKVGYFTFSIVLKVALSCRDKCILRELTVQWSPALEDMADYAAGLAESVWLAEHACPLPETQRQLLHRNLVAGLAQHTNVGDV